MPKRKKPSKRKQKKPNTPDDLRKSRRSRVALPRPNQECGQSGSLTPASLPASRLPKYIIPL